MRSRLSIAAFFAVFCLASTAKALDDPIVEVPFTFEAGHVIVQAKIKNDLPIAFILSTGAEFSSLDNSLLQKYKLPAYFTVTGRDDHTVTYTPVPDIRVGGAHQTLLHMRFVSLEALSKKLGREIGGILGIDFFKGRTVQFDFARKVVRFLPESDKDSETKDLAVARRTVLKMTYINTGLTVPIVEDITIQGKKIKTLFDTGAVTVVSLSASAGKQLGLAAPKEKEPPRPDKIASLRLGADEEIANLPVLIYGKGSDFDRDEFEFGAVVGTILLQNFSATFDFRKKVIILER